MPGTTQRPLRLSAIAHGSHPEVVARARDAIGHVGGFILDFTMFSNSILVLSFEVPGSGVGDLVERLETAGIELDTASRTAADERIRAVAASGTVAEVAGSLSVNLIHDDPPLRIDVPAVPG